MRLYLCIFIAFLLSASNNVASQDFSIKYRNLNNILLSNSIHAEIVIQNISGHELNLSDIHVVYNFSNEGNVEIENNIIRAIKLGQNYQDILSVSAISNTNEKITIHFNDLHEKIRNSELIVVQFSTVRVDGSQFDQSNDQSFIEAATALQTTNKISVLQYPMVEIQGVVESEEGGINDALVIINGIRTVSNINGEFSAFIKQEEKVNIKIEKQDYSDYFKQFSIDKLYDRENKVARQTKAFIHRYEALKLIFPNRGGEVETDNGVLIDFPSTTTYSAPFDILLTSLTSADDSMSDTNTYEGVGFSIGSSALQFFHSIDVYAVDLSTNQRTHLTNYYPAIQVQIPTNCNNQHLSPLPVWYLDETTGIWIEHNEKAVFWPKRLNGRCYFAYFTDHFTRYALARPYATEFRSLAFDTSLLANTPNNTEYLLEIENAYGHLYETILTKAQLATHVVEDIPATRDAYVRLTDMTTQASSSTTVPDLENSSTQTVTVELKEPVTSVWRSQWINRDLPGGNGDYETYDNTSYYCEAPLDIKARVVGQTLEYSPGDVLPDTILAFNRNVGLICEESAQDDNACNDYEIKLLCPSNS